METKKEIESLLQQLGGNIVFETPVICKVSPHSRPEIIKELKLTDDLSVFSIHMLYTIRQRLKLLIYQKNNP